MLYRVVLLCVLFNVLSRCFEVSGGYSSMFVELCRCYIALYFFVFCLMHCRDVLYLCCGETLVECGCGMV
jgi:hypothetical protein